MAKKISQLVQATEVKSDDVAVIVQDEETKKLPLNMMVTKQDIENKKVAGLAKLDEIEATYENDTYTPTITVKNKSSVKVGEGDGVDYSANVMDGHAKSAILKGCTGYRDIDTGEILETFEEGRNLELVSVKMPVLTTTGKNLFDGKLENGAIVSNTGVNTPSTDNVRSVGYIRVNPNASIVLSNDLGYSNNIIYEYDINKNFIGRKHSNPFTTSENCHYIRFRSNTNQPNLNVKYQIEYGTQPTTYEPYKTNILSTSEDVVLRGIEDVRDELDLITGKLVQCVGEETLTADNWGIQSGSYENNFVYRAQLDTNKIDGYYGVICDTQPVYPVNWGFPQEGLYVYGCSVYIAIDKKLNPDASTLEGFKENWASKNPITVQYLLKEKSIKTVDLIPSGTHPSTTPYCWKDGHIQLSSSGLLPSLEYSVVTSRAGQISQNAAMIVKNDKRIFDLEILLAGGLVNTTYQALILQNQVETGLSKVSLSSEKEPDYLLYHMIMKLIEEKAYKLDDLTEKVSVFYLYEKLSDEQFETIYSELYPFVEEEYIELPEDGEIIEEPIVDEVLEEVENGVVM